METGTRKLFGANNQKETNTNSENNKKLSFMQRLAYTIIDFGTIFLLFFGLYQLALHTPVSNNLHNAETEMYEIQIEKGTATGFYVKTYLEEGQSTNAVIYEDEGGKYYYNLNDEFRADYQQALKNDEKYSNLKFAYTVNSFAIFLPCLAISELIFIIVVPLTNKRRATLGILSAGGRSISKKYVDKARWYHLMFKFVFIFFIDSALPYFIFGEVALLFIPFLTLLSMLTNKERRTIHDIVSGIMVIDNKTYVPLVDRESDDENEASDKPQTGKEA